MNCSRLRKWLPLYAGADLSAGKSRRLEKHLERCPCCRKEIEELRAVLAGVRVVAEQETLDWTETEWKDLMARVKSRKPRTRPVSPFSAMPRKAWAYGFALVLVLGFAALILRGLFSPRAPLLHETLAATLAQPSRLLRTDEASSARHLRDIPFQVKVERRALERTMLAAGPAPEKEAQIIMSMTLVSQETGLKVHWTLNKNFDWEEKIR